jgi:hypothetical protein
MSTETPALRIPTAADVLARQRADHGGTAVATVAQTSTAVAVPDNRSTTSKYLDEIAPSSIVGRMIKFDKNGKFVTPDDDGEMKEDVDFVVLADQLDLAASAVYAFFWDWRRAVRWFAAAVLTLTVTI